MASTKHSIEIVAVQALQVLSNTEEPEDKYDNTNEDKKLLSHWHVAVLIIRAVHITVAQTIVN